MINTNLTANERRAALILVGTCLDGMGGSRPADLEQDEYTWVDAGDLMAHGYSAAEAAGTFGALMAKGFVAEYDRGQLVLQTAAWRFLDTIWDAHVAAQTAAVEPTPATYLDLYGIAL